jgi:hypothetical protein
VKSRRPFRDEREKWSQIPFSARQSRVRYSKYLLWSGGAVLAANRYSYDRGFVFRYLLFFCISVVRQRYNFWQIPVSSKTKGFRSAAFNKKSAARRPTWTKRLVAAHDLALSLICWHSFAIRFVASFWVSHNYSFMSFVVDEIFSAAKLISVYLNKSA